MLTINKFNPYYAHVPSCFIYDGYWCDWVFYMNIDCDILDRKDIKYYELLENKFSFKQRIKDIFKKKVYNAIRVFKNAKRRIFSRNDV